MNSVSDKEAAAKDERKKLQTLKSVGRVEQP